MDMTQELNIVSRKDWGAEEFKDPLPLNSPVPYVVQSLTDTEVCYTKEDCIAAMKELQKAHIKDGSSDIKQNFIIGGDGNVYEGRGWIGQPEFQIHSIRMWEHFVEISHFGNDGMPSINSMDIADNLIALGVKKGIIKVGYKCDMFFEPSEDDQMAEEGTEPLKELEDFPHPYQKVKKIDFS